MSECTKCNVFTDNVLCRECRNRDQKMLPMSKSLHLTFLPRQGDLYINCENEKDIVSVITVAYHVDTTQLLVVFEDNSAGVLALSVSEWKKKYKLYQPKGCVGDRNQNKIPCASCHKWKIIPKYDDDWKCVVCGYFEINVVCDKCRIEKGIKKGVFECACKWGNQ